MKIIILTHYFPPLNSVASLRPYSWARYWTIMGHNVTVVTTKKHRSDFDLNFENNGFIVKEIEYKGFNNTASIKREETIKQNTFSFKSKLKSYVKQIVLYFRKRYGILSAERIPESIHFWMKPALKTIIEECSINNTDVVVSTYAPPSAHIVAYKLKKQFPYLTWVADYRDSWTVSNYSQKGFPIVSLIERYFENKILQRVDLISVAFKTLEEEFKSRFSKEVVVIENGCFDEKITSTVKTLINKSTDKINFVYTGSFGGYRSLKFFYDFLLKLKKYDLELYEKINLYILGSGDEKFIHEKMIYLGKVGYGESLSYQYAADVLLLVESGEEVASGNMTGKVYEYIAAKKPIIAFGPKEHFSISKRLKELDAGIVSEKDFQSIYNSIITLMGRNFNFGDISQYTRSYQANKLLKSIEKIKGVNYKELQ
jgi:hypothetical protein